MLLLYLLLLFSSSTATQEQQLTFYKHENMKSSESPRQSINVTHYAKCLGVCLYASWCTGFNVYKTHDNVRTTHDSSYSCQFLAQSICGNSAIFPDSSYMLFSISFHCKYVIRVATGRKLCLGRKHDNSLVVKQADCLVFSEIHGSIEMEVEGKCIKPESMDDGAKLRLVPRSQCTEKSRYLFEKTADGKLIIKHHESGKCLYVSKGGGREDSPVVLYSTCTLDDEPPRVTFVKIERD